MTINLENGKRAALIKIGVALFLNLTALLQFAPVNVRGANKYV